MVCGKSTVQNRKPSVELDRFQLGNITVVIEDTKLSTNKQHSLCIVHFCLKIIAGHCARGLVPFVMMPPCHERRIAPGSLWITHNELRPPYLSFEVWIWLPFHSSRVFSNVRNCGHCTFVTCTTPFKSFGKLSSRNSDIHADLTADILCFAPPYLRASTSALSRATSVPCCHVYPSII